MSAHIAVAGGMNLDILGTPSGAFAARDSNPGTVRMRPGGVGRNIAAQAARLGAQVTLFTALGGDASAAALRGDCAREGIDLAFALQTTLPTSTYLCIHDGKGDMFAAINDMALCAALTPAYFARVLPAINRADVCVLDANLPPASLEYLAQNAAVPLLLDPVSCHKAARALPILKRLAAVKPNLAEARALTGCGQAEAAGAWLLERGVERAFISLGAQGVYYADRQSRGYAPALSISARDTTGAGDAFCAGLALSLAEGLPAAQCAAAGCRAAARHLNQPRQEDF